MNTDDTTDLTPTRGLVEELRIEGPVASSAPPAEVETTEPADSFPLVLTPAAGADSVMIRHAEWLDLAQRGFQPDTQPWLPVGNVGPLPVLAHHRTDVEPLLPWRWFQPVRLSPAEYARHLAHCASVLPGVHAPDWARGDPLPPRRAFPGCGTRLILPTTVRAALRFLLEYFPLPGDEAKRVRELLAQSDGLDPQALPPGYFAACWRLLGRGAVVDLAAVQPPVRPECRIPAALVGKVVLVSEQGRDVWIAAAKWPQPDVEDLLLNELGAEWRVHFLLAEAFAAGAAGEVGDRGPGVPLGDAAGRVRVKIGDQRPARGAGSGPREPGVIRLSEKEIKELEAYDARRPDRDPLRVFLKQLSAGIRHAATDLHLELGLETYRVRARIDGYLEEWLEMPADFGRMLVGAAKEQFGMPPERWLPQDGACTVHHGSEIVNLRIAAYPIRGAGQKLAIRYLPRRGKVPPLDELMPAAQAALVRRAITRPYGLILLCGPTGSGKTTTTFSALSEINTPDVNITTMEDPVEYEMDGVNQAELDRARDVGWEALLSGFLRQDPDVGMVGEIRDRATAETAIRLTLTGHIVFATLHTMSCAHTVERLVDTGVNAQMFANAASLLISQRLVRRLCRRCREHGRRPPTEAERVQFAAHGVVSPAFVHDAARVGCDECRGSGYRGQIGAFELLPVTPDVAELIAQRRPVQAIEDWMTRRGLPRVYAAALQLVASGETTSAEADQWQPIWENLNPPPAEASSI